MTAPSLEFLRRPRSAPVTLAFGCALGLRLLAAVVLDRHVAASRAPQNLCLFPDTRIYWALAATIRRGEIFQVSLWGVPHYALRTPGYPLFLAVCQALFGDRTLPVRTVQAVLGAGCSWLVYRLLQRVGKAEPQGAAWPVPVLAALLVALDPYAVLMAVLLLSEAVFVPLMLLTLWGLAILWQQPGEAAARAPLVLSLGTGVAAGGAILVRPSWALFLPIVLMLWIFGNEPEHRAAAVRRAVLVAIGIALIMAPWWVRNTAVFHRFVPTALWMGPSLYDGLSPHATGASDMRFLDDPEIRTLDEPALDATLAARAWAFARSHPDQAIRLAVIKTGRFWSPWPNADTLRSPAIAFVTTLITLPLYALMLVGLWDRRHDLRALGVLAGPVLYFWALHVLFVGSIRYRIPGAIPAFGLAAIGANRLLGKWTKTA